MPFILLLLHKNSSLLTKFFYDKKLTFATNSANLPTSWLQTCRNLFGSFPSIFHLKFRMQFTCFY
ncbi:PIN family toxin-antitoxin system [Fusobacterium canifelinum]|uniref:PIN family toxin-antitoxin system n=1 Tax=Fusobacterium canifelinum TaxID=285729 RepID=A0A3P1USN8_9FUSO|nr:PIN family toxin-antitoxin system [Fusobacterium canifelinum]